MSEDDKRFERGLEILEQLGWSENPLPRVGAADKEFWRVSVANLFGDIWAREGLSIRDRELVTLASLIALGQGGAAKTHFGAALRMGFTADELREVVIHVMHYAGWPAGTHGIVALKEAVDEAAGEPA